jgi:hypothetical protein
MRLTLRFFRTVTKQMWLSPCCDTAHMADISKPVGKFAACLVAGGAPISVSEIIHRRFS